MNITVYASLTGIFTEEECDVNNLTEIEVSDNVLELWLSETDRDKADFLETYTADETEPLVWWLLDNGYGLNVPGIKIYRYGMRLRGYSIGCQPKEGLLWRESDSTGTFYDIVAYRNPLSESDIKHYSLELL